MENKLSKRAANWGETERAFAIQLILENLNSLNGKFRGATNGAKVKQKTWEDISDQLKASGHSTCERTSSDIKKMFCNMKSRAKEKYDLSKKTGGGPVVPLSPVEEQIVDHLLANNRSQLKGLETGIDSMSSHPEKLVQDLHVHEVPDVCSEVVTVQEVFEGNNLIDSNNNTLSYVPLAEITQNKPKKTNVSAKRRHEDKEDELYLLEKKKIQAEINQIEQKTEHDKELFLLQKKILEKQINQL